MAENFILRSSSPALNRAVDESSNFDEMKNALHRALGMKSPEELLLANNLTDTGYGAGIQPGAPLPAVAEPAAAQTHIRVFYPYKNSRFEIYSDSEEGLDSQEQKIRALFPQQ
jgi:hypothetical protein